MADSSTSRFDIDQGSIVAGPVQASPFIPGSSNVFPRFKETIHETAWELWYFDGTGNTGFVEVRVGEWRAFPGRRNRRIYKFCPNKSVVLSSVRYGILMRRLGARDRHGPTQLAHSLSHNQPISSRGLVFQPPRQQNNEKAGLCHVCALIFAFFRCFFSVLPPLFVSLLSIP